MGTTIIKSDADIVNDVLLELEEDPRADEKEVGVQVVEGIVTLTGSVGSYARKVAALEAAHRVSGVLDVVDEMELRIPSPWTKRDIEIAQRVRDALEWDAFAPDEEIRSTVSKGWVTLEGEVDYPYQRIDAGAVVQRQFGVRGVHNLLTVKPEPIEPEELRSSITAALKRQSEREAQHIEIKVKDGVVNLRGTVHSWSEKNAIGQLARHAPGVLQVQNELIVDAFG